MPGDDAVVKVISRLTVDYSQAIRGIKELAQEYAKLNDIIKQVEQAAKSSIPGVSTGTPRTTVSDAARTVSAQKQSLDLLERQVLAQKALVSQLQAQAAAIQAKLKLEQLDNAYLEQNADFLRNQAEELVRVYGKQGELTESQLLQTALLREQLKDLRARVSTAVSDLTLSEQRRVAAAAAVVPQLQAQAAAIQSRLKLERISSQALREQAEQLRRMADEYANILAREKTLTKEQAQGVEILQERVKALRAQVSTAAADERSRVGGTLASMLQRRWEWFLAGLGFYGAQQAFNELVTGIGNVEERMISFARVMEDPLFNIRDMRTELFQLGKEFGQSFETVEDIALRWAQAGYSMSETLELTKASLLAVNTAELDAASATEALIGIQAQWGFQSDQLITVIDKLNRVADDYAVTTQDLVDGLLRSSGAAKTAGMTFEQTVAILTAMREASGRTGREVGNALNSIVAYLKRQKSLETLESAGIPVFSDAQQQKLRSVFDILADLAAKWNELSGEAQQALMEEAEAAGLFTEEIASASGALEEWTDLQKRDILQAGAGVYRRNYLLALLKNFAEVYQVLQTEEQALGYSERENAKTMEGFNRQVQSLKTAILELAYAIGEEGGLLNILKDLAQRARILVDVFNGLPPSAKQAVIAIGELALVFGALNTVLRFLTGKSLAAAGLNFINAMRNMTGSVSALVATMSRLGTSAIRYGPWLAALATIAYAIKRVNDRALELQNTFEEMTKKSDALISSLESEGKLHTQNSIKVKQLAEQYRVLAQKREEAQQRGQDETNLAIQQQKIADQIKEALGEEAAARLEAANYSEEAANLVAQAEQEKAAAVIQRVQDEIEAYRLQLLEQAKAAEAEIQVIEGQMEGWETYLTFGEKVRLYMTRIWAWIREGWYNLLASVTNVASKIASVGASLLDLVHLDGLAEKFRSASASLWAQAVNWRMEAAAIIPRELEEAEKAIAQGPLQRARETLAQIREKILSLSASTALGEGTGYQPSPGEFGTGEEEEAKEKAEEKTKTLADVVRDLADAYTQQVEALQALGEHYQRQENFLRARIDYYTREGASLEELMQADKDRAALIENLNQQQANLHETAEAARQAVRDLQAAMQGFDRSTEEGRQAYEELNNELLRQQETAENASAEWWRLEKEKAELQKENNAISRHTIEVLDDLKEQYDKGLISLEDYIAQLETLGQASNLSAEALEKLQEAMAEALQEKWSRAIQEALDARIEQIDGQIELLDSVMEEFDKEQRRYERLTARSRVETSLNKLLGIDTFAGGVSQGDITSLVRNTLNQFANLSLGDLSPEAFADAIKRDLATLRDASRTAQGYLDRVAEDYSRRIAQIDRQIQRIDERLEERLAELQAELDALEEEQKEDERAKATEEYQARRKALEDQLTWYLQNEDKYYFEIAALRRQIADEEKAFAEQQAEWRREDRRKAIEEEMQRAREEAERRKARLEAEKAELEAQNEAVQDLLKNLMDYIQAEIEARQELLNEEKEQLNQTKEELNNAMDEITDKVLSTLATMSQKQPEFEATARGLIQKLIDGIRSEESKLREAVDDIKDLIASIPDTVTVRVRRVTEDISSTTTTGTKVLGEAYPAAEGAYIKGGYGGVLALVGEKSHDEVILPVNKLQPMISKAVAQAASSTASLGRVVSEAVRMAVSEVVGLFPSKLEAQFTLPDGAIEKQVVNIFNPFGHVVRAR